MKTGPKPGNGKKVSTAITIDKELKTEIDTRTENLSGFLNEAGWKEIHRSKRQDAKREKPE